MLDTHHSKQAQTDQAQTTPVQKSANARQDRTQQNGYPTRIPAYAQAWDNLPPPWLRLSPPQQHAPSPKQPLQHQVDEELQNDLARQHMREPLPTLAQKGTLPVQRVTAVPVPVYIQLAWGNQPPPWLRLPVQQKEPHEEEALSETNEPPTQRKENTTGLPDTLKAGVETLSGMSMDDVGVHYNSPKPAQVQALAYTQGTEIYVAPGQEEHLQHEAWHVVQQKQRRVQPTMQIGRVLLNDNPALEREAEQSGMMVARLMPISERKVEQKSAHSETAISQQEGETGVPIQMMISYEQYDTERRQTPSGFLTRAHLAPLPAAMPGTDAKSPAVGAVALGYGGDIRGGGKLTTSIEWGPVDPMSGEGTLIEAERLGPDHPLGSPPNANETMIWNQRTAAFTSTFEPEAYQPFKAGHLLNAQLGGPGDDARNLTCISASANTNMQNKMEDDLRKAVNDKFQWIHFKATVTYSKLSKPTSGSIKFTTYASQIVFDWGPIDSTGKPTGSTQTMTLTIPDPSLHAVSITTTTAIDISKTPQAETERALDDFILDELTSVKKQFESITLQRPAILKHYQTVNDLQKELHEKNKKAEEQTETIVKQEEEITALKDAVKEEKDARSRTETELEAAKLKGSEQEQEIRRLKAQIESLQAAQVGLNSMEGGLKRKKSMITEQQATETPVTSMITE